MTQSALVVGAGGAVGEAAAQALAALGWRVTASMRTQRPDAAERLRRSGANVVSHDVEEEGWPDGDYDAAVFVTRLDLTVRALERAAGLSASRVVAFSSNNVAVHPEAEIYRRLAAAEEALRARCPGAAIVRPTMIYGDARLPTLTRLMRMARKWPVLPLPGSGRARVQPVFHEDLGRVAAGLAAVEAPGVYAVGGPDVVTMRQLFEAAARAARARCSFVAIPAALLRVAAPALSFIGFSDDQVARAERDRLAVTQTPLPADLAPRTALAEGLARHAAAIA
jgi:NADH dehydrogenase